MRVIYNTHYTQIIFLFSYWYNFTVYIIVMNYFLKKRNRYIYIIYLILHKYTNS